MLHSYKMQFNVEVFRIQYSDRALLRNTLQITVLGLYSVTVYILKVSFPTLVLLQMHQQIRHQTKLESGVHHTLLIKPKPPKLRPNLRPWIIVIKILSCIEFLLALFT